MKHRKALRGELCLDIGNSSIKILLDEQGLELPLERMPGGELTGASRKSVRSGIQSLLEETPGASRKARCAIPARGVSLRRLALPATSRDELLKLLALQVEREFPLPPEDLAWGYAIREREGPPEEPRGNGKGSSQEVFVAAVKRSALEEYRSLLAECGLKPAFSLGALAGSALCPRAKGLSALLDVGRTHTELLLLEDGRPLGLSTLAWGGETVTQAIAGDLGIDPAEAEKLKRSLRKPSRTAGGMDGDPRAAAASASAARSVRSLAALLRKSLGACLPTPDSGARLRIFLAGGGSRIDGLSRMLAAELGGEATVEALDLEEGTGISAATLGLLRWEDGEGQEARIVLNSLGGPNGKPRVEAKAAGRSWLRIALLLALILAALTGSRHYATPFFQRGRIEERIAAYRQRLASFPKIDRELTFLSFISESQDPFLDMTAVAARAARRGLRISTISMNRQGEIALDGSLQNYQEVGEFRAKLTESGWFSQVVLQEQAPTKDRQRVEFKMSARLKPAGSRPPLKDPEPGSEKEEPPDEAGPVEPPPGFMPETPPPPPGEPAGAPPPQAAPSPAGPPGSLPPGMEKMGRIPRMSRKSREAPPVPAPGGSSGPPGSIPPGVIEIQGEGQPIQIDPSALQNLPEGFEIKEGSVELHPER